MGSGLEDTDSGFPVQDSGEVKYCLFNSYYL
jgi:hypothetical protein